MSDDEKRAYEGHYVRVEVTVAVVVVAPDDQVLNGSMTDATMAFGIAVADPERPPTDEEVVESLRSVMTPALAVITSAVTLNLNAVVLGQLAHGERLVDAEAMHVGVGRTTPVRVHVVEVNEGGMIHD